MRQSEHPCWAEREEPLPEQPTRRQGGLMNSFWASRNDDVDPSSLRDVIRQRDGDIRDPAHDKEIKC